MTRRERMVVLFASGRTYKEIGGIMGCCWQNIRYHIVAADAGRIEHQAAISNPVIDTEQFYKGRRYDA